MPRRTIIVATLGRHTTDAQAEEMRGMLRTLRPLGVRFSEEREDGGPLVFKAFRADDNSNADAPARPARTRSRGNRSRAAADNAVNGASSPAAGERAASTVDAPASTGEPSAVRSTSAPATDGSARATAPGTRRTASVGTVQRA